MTTPPWDTLWTNARIATMRGGRYSIAAPGAIAASGGTIAWVGESASLPAEPRTLARAVHDVGGRFERRLQGASYEDIARAGGGIVATVAATRAATDEALEAQSARRLRALLDEGVTTIEIKSGYGLRTDDELKQLRVARRLGDAAPVTVRTTFLGAHAVPPEFQGRTEAYVSYVCDEMLPAVAAAGVADAVDAFCEAIAFSPEQTARVFERAGTLGLPVKLHADQLSDLGGAALAARFRALSADHLEYTSEAGVRALAAAGTVAVLLPGAFYFLRETRVPPVQLLRDHGVPIAVATDCNPGSAPLTSILLALNMACTLFRLTPEEALAGITCHAARALGLTDSHGTLEVGKACDLVVWEIDAPADLAYAIGTNPCIEVVRGGRSRAL
jgi:imidazolonepropionase